MTEVSSQFTGFVTGEFSRASQDRQIAPREVNELTRAIDRMSSLSGPDKQAVKEIIRGLGDASTADNFFRNRQPISAKDMAILEAVASGNSLAQRLLHQFKTASAPVARAQERSQIRQVADTPLTDPGAVRFSNNSLREAMRPEWYLNQYNTGLPSTKGDCGPTSAAMIARSFGFQTDLSEREVVQLSRQVSGGKTRGGAPWAIDTSQISRAVNRLTGGQIKETGQRNFSAGQGEQVLANIRDSLARGQPPILLSGVPGSTEQPFRHYMTGGGTRPAKSRKRFICGSCAGFSRRCGL